MSWYKIHKMSNRREQFCLCEKSNISNLNEFLDKNGFIKIGDRPHFTAVNKYICSGKDNGRYSMKDEPPYYDHVTYLKNQEGRVYCVYQPYATVGISKEIEQWAINNGLSAMVYDCEFGWYSPDTILVILGVTLDELIISKAF